MEDAWIDNNAGGLPSTNASTEDDFNGMSNMLDVMIRGMMVGFFFPLGAMTWLLRSNVWSEKWQVFVGSGVALSLTVGVVMSLSSMNH
jgi:low affinity Fe/Cu permease